MEQGGGRRIVPQRINQGGGVRRPGERGDVDREARQEDLVGVAAVARGTGQVVLDQRIDEERRLGTAAHQTNVQHPLALVDGLLDRDRTGRRGYLVVDDLKLA